MERTSSTRHATGYGSYILVWAALIVLTGITVTVAAIDLGRINIVAALLIAATKAGLVLYFFMHLREETGLFKIILFVAVATIAVIIGFTFFDIAFR